MTVKLYLEELLPERVGFSYSVLQELLLSLRVLDDYKHHPLHITWVLKTRKQLAPNFHAELRFFRLMIREVSHILWNPEKVETPSFETELDLLSDLPNEEFVQSIITIIGNPSLGEERRKIENFVSFSTFQNSEDLQIQARQWLMKRYPESSGTVDLLLDDPVAYQKRFIEFLQAYWDLSFHEMWAEIEAYYMAEVVTLGKRLFQKGTLQTLASLSPRTKHNYSDESVSFLGTASNDFFRFTRVSHIRLRPSYFLYPTVIFFINMKDSGKISLMTISYPMSAMQEAGQSPVAPEDLLRMLKGLSDPVRMQIIQLIVKQARSTSELSQIIGISNAAISKHLRLLQDGDWLSSYRESYFVYYQINASRLYDLEYALQHIFNDSESHFI